MVAGACIGAVQPPSSRYSEHDAHGSNRPAAPVPTGTSSQAITLAPADAAANAADNAPHASAGGKRHEPRGLAQSPVEPVQPAQFAPGTAVLGCKVTQNREEVREAGRTKRNM